MKRAIIQWMKWMRSSRNITSPRRDVALAGSVVPAVAAGVKSKAKRALVRLTSEKVTTEEDWLKDGFQPGEPDMEDFLSESPPRWLRDAHYAVIFLIFALVITASIVKVDIVVVGIGRLASDDPPIVVQPMQLSMIREIMVKTGDMVKKGDVLATLDPTFTQADRASLSTAHAAMKAELARVEAEVNNKPLLLDDTTPENRLQMELYRKRQSEYQLRVAEFDQQITRYTTEISSIELNRNSLKQQLQVAKEAETMRETLFKNKTGSKIQLLDAQTNRMRTERDLQSSINELDGVRHKLKTVQSERQTFMDVWQRELLQVLAKLRTELSSTSESLAKAERLNELVVLRAPEDCVVLEVAKRSVGSVLQSAEPFATLVPVNAKLVADITINSADVGYAKEGDEVVIKVDSFPYQRHGLLYGTVRSIGKDSFSNAGGNAPLNPAKSTRSSAGVFHHSIIALTKTDLQDMPEGTRLIPGMSLTAEIKVGSRTVISYFLYPITRGLNESIREP